MADKQQEVTLHRSFAYTDKDGKQYYFTRANQHLIGEVMPQEHLQAYADRGMIEFTDKIELPPAGPTEIPRAEAQPVVKAAPVGGIKPSTTTATAKER